jgi:hypothetical protein
VRHSGRSLRPLALGLALVAAVAACTGSAATSSPGGNVSPGTSPGATDTTPAATSGASGSLDAGAATPAPASSSKAAPGSKATPTRSALPTRNSVLPPPPPPGLGYSDLILYRVPIGGSLNGQYWLIKADGTGNRKLALGAYAHWKSGGTTIEVITYSSSCVPSLGVYPISGTGYTAVSIAFQAGDGSFAWTPDGKKLSFYRYTGGYVCGGNNLLNYARNLYAVNADGTGLTEIAAALPMAEPISWVPDGSGVVIARNPIPLVSKFGSASQTGPIQRINTSTKAVTQVLSAGNYEGVYVSPDGKLLAYIVYSGTQWRTHVIDIRGPAPLKYTLGWYGDHDFGTTGAQDGSVVWGTNDANMAILSWQLSQYFNPPVMDGFCWDYDATHPQNQVNWCGEGLSQLDTQSGKLSFSPDNSSTSYIQSNAAFVGTTHTLTEWDIYGKGAPTLPGTENADWVAWEPAP